MKIHKLFVTFLYPGSFFSEESSETIYSGEEKPNIELEIKNFLKNIKKYDKPQKYLGDWFCFYFSTRTDIEDDETFIGKSTYIKGKYYIGELFNLKQVAAMAAADENKYGILYSNMKNNYKQLIKTRRGNFQPFEKEDKLVEIS